MGCDIHMYIEWKIGTGEWKADHHHDIYKEDDYENVREVSATGRNYELFGRIAGVRGSCRRSLYPKGLPKNISDMIKRAAEFWNGDGHSHSYLSLSTFKKILLEFDYYNHEYHNNKSIDAFYDYDIYRGINYNNMPSSFTTIIHYCEHIINDHFVEHMLLGNTNPPPIRARVIFWFDN